MCKAYAVELVIVFYKGKIPIETVLDIPMIRVVATLIGTVPLQSDYNSAGYAISVRKRSYA